EQWMGGEGGGAEARHLAPGGGGRADERLGVGGRRHRHVAALAVGKEDQAGVGGRLAGGGERLPAWRGEALEAGELRLHRDAVGTHARDQLTAVGGDGTSGENRRRGVAFGLDRDPR